MPELLYPAATGSVPPAVLDTVAPMLAWGNNSVGASTSTRYLSPFWDNVLGQTSPIQYRVSRAGKLRNLRVRHNSPAGNGNTIVYTLRVNSVASALTVSLASTASDASLVGTDVPVVAGDLLDIVVTKAAGVVSSPKDVIATCEFGVA